MFSWNLRFSCLFLILFCVSASAGNKVYKERSSDFESKTYFSEDSFSSSMYVLEEAYKVVRTPEEYSEAHKLRIKYNRALGRRLQSRIGNISFHAVDAYFQLDPELNLLEITSLNNHGNQLLEALLQCAGEEDVSSFYEKQNFKNCPDLFHELKEYKLQVFSFVLNSSFSQDPILGMYHLDAIVKDGYGVEQSSGKNLNSNLLFGNEYSGDYLLSEAYTNHLALAPGLYSPLFIQTLLEFSSLNIYPYVKGSGKRAESVDPLMEYSFSFSGSKEDAHRYKILESFVKNHYEKAVNEQSTLSKKFETYLVAALNSHRLLANISFFIKPDEFGLFPRAAKMYLMGVLYPAGVTYNTIGPYPSITARNLIGSTDSSLCNCDYLVYKKKPLWLYRQMQPWRNFVKIVFPDIEKVEFDYED